MRKLASKVAEPAQIQPKSQFLFHKNLPPRDFSLITLHKMMTWTKNWWVKKSNYPRECMSQCCSNCTAKCTPPSFDRLRIAKKSFSPIKKPTRQKSIDYYAILLAISNSHMLKMFSRSLFRPKAFVFSRIVKSQQGDFYVMPRKCFLRSIFTIRRKSLWNCILGIFAFTNYFLSLQY